MLCWTWASCIGNKCTFIICDRALYELATAIRMKELQDFEKVIILLRGLHQAHIFLKTIFKIMRNRGGEELLFRSGLCQEGTANKIFGERANYYQSLHALQILNEAIWLLFWEAFQIWLQNNEIPLDEALITIATEIVESYPKYTKKNILELTNSSSNSKKLCNNNLRQKTGWHSWIRQR